MDENEMWATKSLSELHEIRNFILSQMKNAEQTLVAAK
jgi:hypothetical protein